MWQQYITSSTFYDHLHRLLWEYNSHFLVKDIRPPNNLWTLNIIYFFTKDHWSVTHRNPGHTIIYHFRSTLILFSDVSARIHCGLFSPHAAITTSYVLFTQAARRGKPSLRMCDNYTASKGIYPCKKPTGLQKQTSDLWDYPAHKMITLQ